jgi:hypothetical protein
MIITLLIVANHSLCNRKKIPCRDTKHIEQENNQMMGDEVNMMDI